MKKIAVLDESGICNYYVPAVFETAEILQNFIVLEGIDGSGTTSQLELIDTRLNELTIPHFKTCEPTKNEIGNLIRYFLSGRAYVRAGTLAYLFASDRYEHVHDPLNGIKAQHSEKKLVLSDRYLFSSLAYQSIDCEMSFVASLNRDFPLPGHLFFLDIPIEVSMERIKTRGVKEIFEKRNFQIKVIESYRNAFSLFSGTQMKIHKIDGTLPKDTVFNLIWDIIKSLPIFSE